ncbi:CGNR zinc finger domain-containing protein [Fulvimonas soli]|jgi:predicted RNA-binding Zn ribbon-like protein|uniref:Putative RNA-binding Zn ribbon-like protein n=1 Tax=Fulvimonas soli TaxID=155197 RepID=A0A316IHJ5_9GAMM|nr:ABATE domain-containing protein [Fulvimonas soli]PWK92997.1 putative RNA-binding Zn ribbon-like protein [Fulvimonas soli]TNY26424.1 hypothetical protein BV497_08985 [Fulvimonas soli]HVX66015.1 ABATE domain-containing protein [Bryobacteraceae bacterium]HWA10408.1 ABATE domain-containing protein [Opitutaceae bacterium]
MPKTAMPSTQDFQFIAGNLALDFVNTVGNRLAEPREYFREARDVQRWTRLSGAAELRRVGVPSAQHLGQIRLVREQLYGVFKRLVDGAAPDARLVAALNARLADVATSRQLVCAGGGVRWQWNDPAESPVRILGPVLLSAANLLTSDHVARLRQCEDPACGWLFLDRSQASRRRWCSMADCGNRAKARRHYGRGLRAQS